MTGALHLEVYGTGVDHLVRVVLLEPYLSRLRQVHIDSALLLQTCRVLSQQLRLAPTYAYTGEQAEIVVLKTMVLNAYWVAAARPHAIPRSQFWRKPLYQSYLRASRGRCAGDRSSFYSHVESRNLLLEEELYDLALQALRFDKCSLGNALKSEKPASATDGSSSLLKWLDAYLCTDYALQATHIAASSALGVTRGGLVALVPWFSKPGDDLAVLLGGHYPFALRQASQTGEFKLLGPSYIHGLMNGEAVHGYQAGQKLSPQAQRTEGLMKYEIV